MSSKPFDIAEFFSGYMAQLHSEGKYFSGSVTHPGEKGRLNETHFASILRRYLPKRFGIGSGFIASTNRNRPRSPQCDIIIYDAVNNAPLYESDAFGIYPIEMVYAVIEVKTDLRAELENCFEKSAFIREMAEEFVSVDDFIQRKKEAPKNFYFEDGDHRGRKVIGHKGYVRMQRVAGKSHDVRRFEKLPPRFFVFAYSGWKTPQTFESQFIKTSKKHPRAHLHGVCVLNDKGGYFTRSVAYRVGDDQFDSVVPQNGFMTFLLTLPQTLDSMLPPHPDRMGNGFDMVDLARYRIQSEGS